MEYRNQRYGEERALYHLQHATVANCRFEGEEDGESALKEGRDVHITDCDFLLRYPLWHCDGILAENCRLETGCRAPIWYTKNATFRGVSCTGVKALRECDGITVKNSSFLSDEVAWRCRTFTAEDSEFGGPYAFFESRDLTLRGVHLTGKYSFQYTENVTVENSVLDTKDAFWHARNVTVTDSVVKGEYLGWYSENLRLVRCRIVGTQPLCYCKGLILEDCTMEGCDFSFEFSEVNARVSGEILSVKNPSSGVIVADAYGDVILEEDTAHPVEGRVLLAKDA
jgi:hypothetical protein